MFSFPVLRTRLSVCFLSSLLASLPQLFHRCFPFAFAFGLSPFDPFPFVRFSSGSYYSASVSSFPLSSRFPLTAGLLRCCLSAFQLPWFSPFFPTRFPVSSFSVLRTRLSVCFLSSLPVSLPQLFHRCFPSTLAFGRSPLFRFLSSTSVLVLTTQLSALSFPFFPFSPVGGSSGASFLFRPACFHAFLPIPVLSFLQFLSPLAVSPHSGYLSASAFFLAAPGLFPLAFALGSGYLASNVLLSSTFGSLCFSFFPQRTSIYYHRTFYLSTPFFQFFKFFYFSENIIF